ncbi:hypothetical protein [Acinetobacter stercoris]|uniref:Uncharacterized protein n=1 Tax=Acinetobacter stercoris TaxID=2126983 RepID=A0A2U3N0P7_9GAMM|nr:hypothetical protein [Acinetobacter stercoris]SPL71250.1 hypothetical protein KPC_2428 [Acinetobacter stercoris]
MKFEKFAIKQQFFVFNAELTLMKIGIFWYHDKTVTGYVHPFNLNDQDALGMVESPYIHNEYWDVLSNRYPDLRLINHNVIPKGRALFSTTEGKVVIHLDEKLLKKSSKKRIAKFLGIEEKNAIWLIDESTSVKYI